MTCHTVGNCVVSSRCEWGCESSNDHLCGFSSLWTIEWVSKCWFKLNDLSHCGQLYFLTRLWMREWVFKCSSLANALLHCWQLYFLTPVWICLWLKRLPLLANVFGHTSHENFWDIFYNHSTKSSSVWRPFHIDVNHFEKILSLYHFPFSCCPLVLW